MNDLFTVPFPIPNTGNALNSQVRINLDAIVTAINNVSNGVTHFNTLSLGEASVFNGQINWYSASNANVVNLAMGNNKNLITDATTVNILSTGVTVGGNNEVELDVQNSSSGTNLGAKLFIRAASVGQGDAYVSLSVANTTAWALGIDNDSSDSFKISKASQVGTNDYFVITTGGVVTLSAAPIFSALTASTVPYLDSSKALTSSAVTPTELGYLSGVSSAIQTQLGLKAPLASPTFTGTVTIPTPFTLGAVSVTATGTELNYVVGVTSAIQTQLGLKAPLASPTFTGTAVAATLDAQTLLKGMGTATNDSAAAGYIGEYAVSTPGTSNFPSSPDFGDYASLSLTAGDWDVSATAAMELNGATVTNWQIGISTTSGNATTGLTFGLNRFVLLPTTAMYDGLYSIPVYRVSLSGTTTVYFKYSANYSAGTPRMYGSIHARRVR